MNLISVVLPVLALGTPSATIDMHAEAMRLRAELGLSSMKMDVELNQIAQNHADWMAANYSMTHGPNDQIIAMGQADAESAFAAWMGSPPHRAWVLSDSERCGWAVSYASNGMPFWCGVFRGDGPAVNTTTYYSSGRVRRGLFRRRR